LDKPPHRSSIFPIERTREKAKESQSAGIDGISQRKFIERSSQVGVSKNDERFCEREGHEREQQILSARKGKYNLSSVQDSFDEKAEYRHNLRSDSKGHFCVSTDDTYSTITLLGRSKAGKAGFPAESKKVELGCNRYVKFNGEDSESRLDYSEEQQLKSKKNEVLIGERLDLGDFFLSKTVFFSSTKERNSFLLNRMTSSRVSIILSHDEFDESPNQKSNRHHFILGSYIDGGPQTRRGNSVIHCVMPTNSQPIEKVLAGLDDSKNCEESNALNGGMTLNRLPFKCWQYSVGYRVDYCGRLPLCMYRGSLSLVLSPPFVMERVGRRTVVKDGGEEDTMYNRYRAEGLDDDALLYILKNARILDKRGLVHLYMECKEVKCHKEVLKTARFLERFAQESSNFMTRAQGLISSGTCDLVDDVLAKKEDRDESLFDKISNIYNTLKKDQDSVAGSNIHANLEDSDSLEIFFEILQNSAYAVQGKSQMVLNYFRPLMETIFSTILAPTDDSSISVDGNRSSVKYFSTYLNFRRLIFIHKAAEDFLLKSKLCDENIKEPIYGILSKLSECVSTQCESVCKNYQEETANDDSDTELLKSYISASYKDLNSNHDLKESVKKVLERRMKVAPYVYLDAPSEWCEKCSTNISSVINEYFEYEQSISHLIATVGALRNLQPPSPYGSLDFFQKGILEGVMNDEGNIPLALKCLMSNSEIFFIEEDFKSLDYFFDNKLKSRVKLKKAAEKSNSLIKWLTSIVSVMYENREDRDFLKVCKSFTKKSSRYSALKCKGDDVLSSSFSFLIGEALQEVVSLSVYVKYYLVQAVLDDFYFQLIDGSVNARENTLLMDEVQELLSGPFQEKDKRISSSRFCETQSTLQKSTLMELPSSEIYAASIDEKIKVFCKNNDQVSTIINLWEKCSCFGDKRSQYQKPSELESPASNNAPKASKSKRKV
jgi:hypothetical protein